MRAIRVSSFVSAVTVVGAVAVIASAQERPPSSGIFVEAIAGQPEVRLPSSRFDTRETGIGKSMATMGLTKPQMHGSLAGPKASTRVAPDTTFRIQLDESGGASQAAPMPDMTSMMGMMNGGDGSIPSIAKGPQDFALVKLSAANEDREANFGTPGASRPKDGVDVIVEKLGPRTFRLKPRHPLPPGEYAFYIRMGNAPAGPAWDFGVDQK